MLGISDMNLPPTQGFGNGIIGIDTGYCRPAMAACYLLRAGDRLAFVDTGTQHSVPGLMALVRSLGLGPEHVDYVIPTHVHLDHAGGAGELMRQCPNASLIVHPKGARHLTDPSKLIAGATAVYGEKAFSRDFGTLVPVSESRVLVAPDGFELEMDGRRLGFLDTPGHANHHFCVFDRETGSFFTGDTFGISYREFDSPKGPFMFAPTTPVAFDPDHWQTTLDRLLSYSPQAMYLTHFGRVEVAPALTEQLRQSIRFHAATALQEQSPKEGRQGRIRQRLADGLLADLKTHGCELEPQHCLEILAPDLDLNAQGLDVWLQRREKRAAKGKGG
jgi:glyoxylase-like metal-dependent hydrolase (beta-lactamase superfamily II)